jgi:hypothetical protein
MTNRMRQTMSMQAAMFRAAYTDSALMSAPPQRSANDLMHRATVCIWVESPAEEAEFAAWEEQWKSDLAFVSHDYGCGCCVHLYDILGSEESITALPKKLRIVSAWTNEI